MTEETEKQDEGLTKLDAALDTILESVMPAVARSLAEEIVTHPILRMLDPFHGIKCLSSAHAAYAVSSIIDPFNEDGNAKVREGVVKMFSTHFDTALEDFKKLKLKQKAEAEAKQDCPA